MSKIYVLKQVHKIPISIDEAWNFFSDPRNLLTITPPFLQLKIKGTAPAKQIFKGQEITYTVKPLFSIPLSWKTEIAEVIPGYMFVDYQVKGPYKLWHHRHIFKAISDGVEMTDIVNYRLPFGWFGSLAHSISIKKKLDEIFTFRSLKINELFGEWPEKQEVKIIFTEKELTGYS
ncbi:MAG: SRPBCC family protein [Chitinophagaceae bacterium]